MDLQSQLSRRERQIMDIVYAHGEASVSDVLAEIPDAAPPPSRSLTGSGSCTDDYRDPVMANDAACSPGTPTHYASSAANN